MKPGKVLWGFGGGEAVYVYQNDTITIYFIQFITSKQRELFVVDFRKFKAPLQLSGYRTEPPFLFKTSVDYLFAASALFMRWDAEKV